MKNYFLILLSQIFPASIRRVLDKLKKGKVSNLDESPHFEINYFSLDKTKRKKALIILSPSSWDVAQKQFPKIKLFNYVGLVHEMVKGLNNSGYLVDIVSWRGPSFEDKGYELVVAHGGYCGDFISSLPDSTVVLEYVSGAHWQSFEKETESRYKQFSEDFNVQTPLKVERSLKGTGPGEDMVSNRSNYLFCLNLPRMVAAYGAYGAKFYYTGLGSYLDESLLFNITKKDFSEGRKNFICVSATGGNIQKGLSVILQAFALRSELNLYIYCKVEPDVLKYCRKELSLNNIHYIYHWSRSEYFKKSLERLLLKTNFVVHAVINSGLGTAFTGCVGLGMIPVGYMDILPDEELDVICDDWRPESLADCISQASEKSNDWCKNAAIKNVERYHRDWSAESFSRKFEELVVEASSDQISMHENSLTS